MAVITESIDELVREAEILKTRLEEERAKFNDMECMSFYLRKSFSIIGFLISNQRGREIRSLTNIHHQISTYVKRSSRQSFSIRLVER